MSKQKLPEEWEEVKLEELFELKYGSSLPEQKRIPGNCNVYGSNGVVGSHNEGITKGKTIIVGRKGSVGKINLSEKSCFPIDTTYYVDETKKPCDLKWIYYILKTLNLEALNRAAAVPGLNRKDVYSIRIMFPPLSTQKKIVSILEKAEQAKEWRKEADKLTNDFLKAVFMEMFLSDKDKFQVKELNEVCETSSGGTPSRDKKEYWENGTILWVKSGELDKGYIYDTEEKITENGLEKSSAKYFDPETVLLAMYGATVGKAALLKVKATTNQAICGIKPKNNSTLNSIYLLHILFSLKEKLISKSIGGGQPNISQSIIKETKIPIPPLSLQHKFASIVRGVEQMKEQQKYSKEQIDNLFNALMQKAFKGELVI